MVVRTRRSSEDTLSSQSRMGRASKRTHRARSPGRLATPPGLTRTLSIPPSARLLPSSLRSPGARSQKPGSSRRGIPRSDRERTRLMTDRAEKLIRPNLRSKGGSVSGPMSMAPKSVRSGEFNQRGDISHGPSRPRRTVTDSVRFEWFGAFTRWGNRWKSRRPALCCATLRSA